MGSQLSKLPFAGELLAPLVGDFGRRAVSSHVVSESMVKIVMDFS